VRIEEDGCGLVAARGFSRLFSRLLGPGKAAGEGGQQEEERVTVRMGMDVWGRPQVGPMRVVKGGSEEEEEEEEEILGAEWEAGALGSGPELEAAAALEEAMAGVDRAVEEAEEARNALEAAVYTARWVFFFGLYC
jgi:hypothetical protein